MQAFHSWGLPRSRVSNIITYDYRTDKHWWVLWQMLAVNQIVGSQWWWRCARSLALNQRPINTTHRQFVLSKDLSDVRVDWDIFLSQTNACLILAIAIPSIGISCTLSLDLNGSNDWQIALCFLNWSYLFGCSHWAALAWWSYLPSYYKLKFLRDEILLQTSLTALLRVNDLHPHRLF